MDGMKNVMWNLFQDTGNIDAYLFYCSCLDGERADAAHMGVKAAEDFPETREKN